MRIPVQHDPPASTVLALYLSPFLFFALLYLLASVVHGGPL